MRALTEFVRRFLIESAFSDRNRRFTNWFINGGILFVIFAGWMEMAHEDVPYMVATANAKLRTAVWQRMRSVCFTDHEINDYWFDQGYWKHPNKLLVIIKGREALCGGRGLCGCKVKPKVKGLI